MSENDHWVSPEGLDYRIDDIAHDITWSTLNDVTILYADPDKPLIFTTMDDERVCDLCEFNSGEWQQDDFALPDIPIHVLCRCFWSQEE